MRKKYLPGLILMILVLSGCAKKTVSKVEPEPEGAISILSANEVVARLNIDSPQYHDFKKLDKEAMVKYTLKNVKMPSQFLQELGVSSLQNYQSVSVKKGTWPKIIFAFSNNQKVTVTYQGARGNKWIEND